MDNSSYKEKLLESGIFRRVRAVQYRCQYCPFCNDGKWHMYVRIDVTTDDPVVYYCQKCKSHGSMNRQFLEYFNLDDIRIPRTTFRKKIDTGKATTSMNITVNENDDIRNVCEYIQSRVGHYPSIDELQAFQYISNPESYVREYFNDCDNVRKLRNRYWFRMTNGGIIGRWFNDNTNCRWLKYRSNILKGRGLYSIKIPVDTHLPINVYIAEGVMDVVGLYYNYIRDNNIYIACMGKEYEAALKYLISLGIFGNSVSVKIFKDADVNVKGIKIDEPLRMLFNKIEVYQNMEGDDYGVLPDKLDIQKIINF
jgi:hypothetical protein